MDTTTIPAMTRTARVIMMVALALAAVLVLLMPLAPVARADTISGDTASAPDPCATSDWADYYLPVLRWQEGTSQITMRDDSHFLDKVKTLFNSMYTTSSYMLSGTMWNWTGSLTETAVKFCPMQKMGGVVDNAAWKMGQAIIGTGQGGQVTIVAILAIILFAGLLINKIRASARGSQGMAKPIIGFVITVAVLSIVTTQAGKSTGAGMQVGDDGPFHPAVMSPGWLVTSVDGAVDKIAAVPVSGFQSTVEQVSTGRSPLDTGGPLSCDTYVQQLKKKYQNAWGDEQSSMTPWATSYVWQSSTLQAWKQAQFWGSAYSEVAWCRYLDSFADYPLPLDRPTNVMGLPSDQVDPGAFAWQSFNSDDWDRRASFMVLWTNCQLADGYDTNTWWNGPFTWRDGGSPGHGLNPSGAPEDATATCKSFFTSADFDYKKFVPPKDSKIDTQTAGYDDAGDFLRSLDHGGTLWKDFGTGLLAALSSLACLIVFGLIVAGGLALCKIMFLFMAFMLVLDVVVGLVKQKGTEAIMAWLYKLVGIVVYMLMVGVMLSLVSLMSNVLIALAARFAGGPGGFASILVSGIAPLLGLWMIIQVFKRAGLPNPISLKGVAAYGKAVGSLGSMANPNSSDMGEGLMNRVGSTAKRGGSKITRAAVGATVGTVAGKMAGGSKKKDDKDDKDGAPARTGGKGLKDAAKPGAKPGTKPDGGSSPDSTKKDGSTTADIPDRDGDDQDDVKPDENAKDSTKALDKDGKAVDAKSPVVDWTSVKSPEAKQFRLDEKAKRDQAKDAQRAKDQARWTAFRQASSRQRMSMMWNQTAEAAQRRVASMNGRQIASGVAKVAATVGTGALFFTPLAPVAAIATAGVAAKGAFNAAQFGVGRGWDALKQLKERQSAQIAAWDQEVARRQNLAVQAQQKALDQAQQEAQQQAQQAPVIPVNAPPIDE